MDYILSEFIKIPNILVMDKDIPLGAKYLYGMIDYYYFVDKTNIHSQEICADLEISLPTLKKYIKCLANKNYIEVDRKNQYQLKLIPLIKKELIIDFRMNQKAKKQQEIQQALSPENELAKKLLRAMNGIEKIDLEKIR